MVGQKRKKTKMEYQRIPFHYIRAEKSHLEMSFGSRRSNSASVQGKAIAWWWWLGIRSELHCDSLPLEQWVPPIRESWVCMWLPSGDAMTVNKTPSSPSKRVKFSRTTHTVNSEYQIWSGTSYWESGTSIKLQIPYLRHPHPPVFLHTLCSKGWMWQKCSMLEQIKLANHILGTQPSQTSPLGLSHKQISQSRGQLSQLNSVRVQEGDQQRSSVMENRDFPPPPWKHIFRSEGQKEGNERYTTAFLLTCKPISVQWFTFWKHQQYLYGSLYKESEAEIRTKENYFEGITYIN